MSKLVIPGVIAQSRNGGDSSSIIPISPLQYQTTSEVVTETVPSNIYYYPNIDDFFDNPELQPTPYTSDTITMTEQELEYNGLLFQFTRGYQPQLNKDFRITGKFFTVSNPYMEIFLNETLQELAYDPGYYHWSENNVIEFYRYNEGDPITVSFHKKDYSTSQELEELEIPCSEITGDHLLYEIYYNHIDDKATFTFKQSDKTLIGSTFIENFSTKVEFSDKTAISFFTNYVDYPEPIDGIYKFETIEVKEVTTKNLELNYDDNTLAVTDGELTVISGGGGTVDQTYDATSTNAQSGTAVAEAVAPALKNTATGTNSLTILGTATDRQSSVNIGAGSSATGQGCVAILGIAGAGSGAVGINGSANGFNSIGICGAAMEYRAIALGGTATKSNSIQFGNGINSTANTLQVYGYLLLDGTTGLIPAERLGTGYDATKTQVLKNVNGTLTWVDE